MTVAVSLTDGLEGTGYTYTGGKGGRAIKAMIDHDLAPFLIGRDAGDIERLHDAMQWHIARQPMGRLGDTAQSGNRPDRRNPPGFRAGLHTHFFIRVRGGYLALTTLTGTRG